MTSNNGTVTASPAPGLGRALRILLLDDSEDGRALMRCFLSATHHVLDMAENGRLGLEKFKAGGYNLVLMDIQMPVMDGYQATRAIRDWERERGLPRTPVIALTAHDMDEDVSRSLDAGCDRHLSKPIKRGDLLRLLQSYAALA